MGELNPGKYHEETLLIQIPENAKKTDRLKLEIRDQESSLPGIVYQWSLDKPLPSYKLQGPVLSSVKLVDESNPSSAEEYLLKAKISDQLGLKDMQVFVNGEKIEYSLSQYYQGRSAAKRRAVLTALTLLRTYLMEEK